MNTAYSNYTKALKAFEEKDWVKCIKICKDIKILAFSRALKIFVKEP